jgi:hypothetical protein
MDELGVPAKLQDDWMGHEDGSVQARAMAARSPVGPLDRLLIARAKEVGE